MRGADPHPLCGLPLKVKAQTRTDAPWRTQRRTWHELLATIVAAGERVCPLFLVPFANSRLLKLDWLHVVDLGVAADYIGGLLWYLVTHKRVAGRNIKARISTLHHSLMAYYERQPPGEKTSRLPKLTRGVVKGKKAKRAKMRCGAGMLRHMVPWAMELAETLLDRRAGDDERAAVESSIHCGMTSLKNATMHSLTLTPSLQTSCCTTPAGSPRMRPPWKTPSPAPSR